MNKTAVGLGVLGTGATATVAAPLALKYAGGSSEGVVKG